MLTAICIMMQYHKMLKWQGIYNKSRKGLMIIYTDTYQFYVNSKLIDIGLGKGSSTAFYY